MTALSDYYENKVLDHMFRAQSFTPPATVYLGLFTTATSDAGGGTEVTGGSYARQAITLGAASGGASSNTAALTFANMPACTVTHAAVCDASSGGNFLMHGPLAAAKTVSAGDTFEIAVGDLTLTIT